MDCNHNQTWVKVNAPVDEGVADLVEALNTFDEVWTTRSCQGDAQSPAWVCFSYGSGHWQELSRFALGHLGPRLAQQLGDQVRLSIRMTNDGLPQGELLVRREAMNDAVEVLHTLARVSPSAFDGRRAGSMPSPPGTVGQLAASSGATSVDMVDAPMPSGE